MGEVTVDKAEVARGKKLAINEPIFSRDEATL